jgi:molecular chaperone GrpE
MSLGECQAALATAEREMADLRDKYLRAAAAIENTRKQTERAAAERAAQRLKNFSAQLIEVADNLERALSHAPQGDALAPGVRATLQLLQTVLRQEGVEPIAVEVGAPFNPQYHEAVAGRVADVPREMVAEVIQTGYTFDGQVLRPARVVVAQPAR